MKKAIIILMLAGMLLPEYLFGGEGVKEQRTELDLKEAIANNIVSVEIRGVYVPDKVMESIDQEGLHYGKCMTIAIKNNIDNPLTIKLNTGTLLMPNDTDIQVMVVSHDLTLDLERHENCETYFYAMCTQIHKFRPSAAETFTIGNNANDSLVRLVKYIEQTFNQNMVGQHAVWAVTDNAGVSELAEYGADSNSLSITRSILNAAHIVTGINKPGRIIVKVSDRTGNNYWLSGARILTLAALMSFWIFLLFAMREHKNAFFRQMALKGTN
jgi:hypothetical protein